MELRLFVLDEHWLNILIKEYFSEKRVPVIAMELRLFVLDENV